MPSFLTHNFSELPEEFYTLQDWQGFNNPKIVIENHVMKKALGMEDTDHQELLKIFNGTRENRFIKAIVYGLLRASIWSVCRTTW